ncbi:MAG: hypothetical protein JJ899_16335, partial [Alphaproteobacteria bacterium]|nr:hypothetical protein [Alphaproteobacteria bacterium]
MTRLTRLALAVCLSVLSAGAALAAEPLNVRAGQHEGFGRIVIDPPRPLAYDAKVEGDRLTISFDEPVAGDVSRIARVIARHVRTARIEDGTRIVADLTGPHTARDFVNEGSIVVDLRPEGAAGLPTVNTRFGRHANFSRMVFDWTGSVGYRLRNSGDGKVSLTFDRPADIRIDARRVRAMRGFDGAAARTADGDTKVDLDVGGRVRHFRDGFKVVVDVFDAPVAETPEPKPAVAKVAPKPPVPPAPAAPAPRAETAESTEVAEEPAPAGDERKPVSLAPPGAEQPETVPASEPEAVFVDLNGPQAEPASLLPTVLTPAPANLDVLPESADDLAVEVISEVDGALLRFPFIRKTGGAIFRRGGSLWIVFDTLARIDTDLIQREAGNFLRDIEQVPHATATVLRLTTIPGYNALSARENTRWEVVLAPQLLKPEEALGVATSSGSLPSVTVGPTLPAEPLRIVDPEVGDEIRVVPVYAAGDGLAQRFLFPDFRLLASILGVALIPLSDRVEVRAGDDRVIVSASGGLRLTDASA